MLQTLEFTNQGYDPPLNHCMYAVVGALKVKLHWTDDKTDNFLLWLESTTHERSQDGQIRGRCCEWFLPDNLELFILEEEWTQWRDHAIRAVMFYGEMHGNSKEIRTLPQINELRQQTVSTQSPPVGPPPAGPPPLRKAKAPSS